MVDRAAAAMMALCGGALNSVAGPDSPILSPTLLLNTTAAAALGIPGLFLAVPVLGAIIAAATTYRQGGQETMPSRPRPGG